MTFQNGSHSTLFSDGGKEKRNKVSKGELLGSTEPTHFHIARRMLTISGK